jgi:L-ascorbate metabolism protein UlaG (beta-lactamase superfamily)
MGTAEAAWATEMVKLRFVIPCHYGAIPSLDTNPEEFKEKAGHFF